MGQQEGAAVVDQTIAYGRQEIVDIFWERTMDHVRRASLTDTKLDRGHVEMGLGKGSGVLLQALVTIMEIVPLPTAIFDDCGVFLTPGSARLAIPACSCTRK